MSYPEAWTGFFPTGADTILSGIERTEIFLWAETYNLGSHKGEFRGGIFPPPTILNH